MKTGESGKQRRERLNRGDRTFIEPSDASPEAKAKLRRVLHGDNYLNYPDGTPSYTVPVPAHIKVSKRFDRDTQNQRFKSRKV